MAGEVTMGEAAQQQSAAGMRPANYHIMFDVEDDHWWYVGRRAIVLAQVAKALKGGSWKPEGGMAENRQSALTANTRHASAVNPYPAAEQHPSFCIPPSAFRILDIGCGTGGNLDHLRRFGQIHGIDLSPIALHCSRQRGHERVMFATANELPFAAESFDLVTALDVIEHLPDDTGGLREIHRILKPGAPVVIFVPAFQSLWGPNDEQSGHQRRYRLPQLRQRVAAAGLQIERISYANTAMFAPIWLGRKILNALGRASQSENRINHPLINKLLAGLFASEAGWLTRHSLPFGVSLLCVARKAG